MKTAIIAALCFIMVFFNHSGPTSSDAGTVCAVTAVAKQATAPAVNRLIAVDLKEEKEIAKDEVAPAEYAATEPAAGPAPEDRSRLRMLRPQHSMMGEDADSYASSKQEALMQALMR